MKDEALSKMEPFAYAEIDGDEWVIYWPNTRTYEHIRDYPHLHTIDPPTPLYALSPAHIERVREMEAENARLNDELRNRVSSQHEWLLVEALSEIKASVDGESDQPVKDIVYGLLSEIEALPERSALPKTMEDGDA